MARSNRRLFLVVANAQTAVVYSRPVVAANDERWHGARDQHGVNGSTGPKFTWATRLHFARRLFECLEWHWIETGQPRRRARRAAYAVAAALLDVEPDSVRQLAYAPSKRSPGHAPRHPPRTSLHLVPQLDSQEAEHLRQLGRALTAMLREELSTLAATVGQQAFSERMEIAVTEAKAEQLTLPSWIISSSNYRQIR